MTYDPPDIEEEAPNIRLKISSLKVVDMRAFCKTLFLPLNNDEMESILIGKHIFPDELSFLLLSIGKLLTDYCLKGMIACMLACLE